MACRAAVGCRAVGECRVVAASVAAVLDGAHLVKRVGAAALVLHAGSADPRVGVAEALDLVIAVLVVGGKAGRLAVVSSAVVSGREEGSPVAGRVLVVEGRVLVVEGRVLVVEGRVLVVEGRVSRVVVLLDGGRASREEALVVDRASVADRALADRALVGARASVEAGDLPDEAVRVEASPVVLADGPA